jgi:hypothetical protein
MDNFDEHDEKLFIEINLNRDIVNASPFIAQNQQREAASEAHENLLQHDNSKLVMQAKNPYTKLAFIKALKDNMICLGYLEETIDTLNYFNEDSINSTMFGSSSKKQRKILAQKRYHDKAANLTTEIYEVKNGFNNFLHKKLT